jgi:DNA-binding NarL/FixJ family response regulator
VVLLSHSYGSEHPRNSIRVLIVDDDRSHRGIIRVFLEQHDDIVVVGEAEDGLEGVKKASELAPDVILMDYFMPKLNGITAIERIRSFNGSVYIIFIATAGENSPDARNAISAGANCIISRLYDPYELPKIVRARQ